MQSHANGISSIVSSELEQVTGGEGQQPQGQPYTAPGSIFEQGGGGVSWSDKNWRIRPGGDTQPRPGKIYNGSDGKPHVLV